MGLVPSCGQGQHCPVYLLLDGLACSLSDCICHLTSTPPHFPAHSQLFNTFPRLGALLRLHRPVLSKIEEVRAILRTLLKARRPPLPSDGPPLSYMEALLQQGQVWTGRDFPGDQWRLSGPSSGEGTTEGSFPSAGDRWESQSPPL